MRYGANGIMNTAPVCYTQNTTESLEIARKHYATSLKLKPSNLQSLYGLYQTAVSLGRHSKKKEAKVRNDDIAQWCMLQLLETYQENCNMEQLKVLENFLKPPSK
uniref:ER membrane protein complex subunit 2 n=1 Tax=Amphimedon queenslandica TaxID=400682 RepID=A0A1X7TDU4_AMPQE